MTTYRLMFGIHPMALFLMPLLFDEHPDELPRFNDAKVISEDGRYITEVISRIGKKYHGSGMGEEKYLEHPKFIRFEDALQAEFNGTEFTDDTYGRYYFEIPAEFYNDIVLLWEKRDAKQTSGAFQKKIMDHFPKMHKQLMRLFTKGNIA